MPDYRWEAVDSRGQMVKGSYSAAAVAEVVVHLRKSRLSPIKVEEAAGSGNAPVAARALKKGRIKGDDVQAMTTELAIMMRAGLSLDNALKVLVEMSHKLQMQAMLQSVLESVKAGMPLSQALGKHHDLFGDFYINMVRSGEASGQMSAVLNRLVEHMARQRELRDSVVSATIYPAILLGVAVLSLVAMLGFVVPQFEQLFNDMGDALPLPTQFVMALGHGFRSYGWAVFLVAGALGWAFSRWAKSPKGRQTWQSWLLGLPGLGGVVRKYQLTLFSRSLGTLLGNGVTLLTALRIASDTVSNVAIRERLEKMGPMVKEGHRMAHAAQKTGEFEPLALNLVRVGEETGRLGDMMLELSNILRMQKQLSSRARKRGFTLIELLVVLAILTLLAGLVGPKVLNQLGGAKTKTAGVQIADIEKALELYKLDVGRYPTSQQGLDALVKQPAGVAGWAGPYLKGGVPNDPWNNPYRYTYPAANGDLEILSLGSDGTPGGEGEASDIRNTK
jgi:general secretion pathway protein F